ncbi:MAG: hypothetical protein QM730_25135 [Anaerolineales bacterium]
MIETTSFPPLNRKALASFIASVVAVLALCIGLLPIPLTVLLCYPPGILLGIASFILGVQSTREIRLNGERGRTLALIAMWVSGLMILAAVCVITSGILLWPYVVAFLKQVWSQIPH